MARNRVLELAGLDEDVDQVAGEHLGAHLLGALDVGLEQDRLLQVAGVLGQFVVALMWPDRSEERLRAKSTRSTSKSRHASIASE